MGLHPSPSLIPPSIVCLKKKKAKLSMMSLWITHKVYQERLLWLGKSKHVSSYSSSGNVFSLPFERYASHIGNKVIHDRQCSVLLERNKKAVCLFCSVLANCYDLGGLKKEGKCCWPDPLLAYSWRAGNRIRKPELESGLVACEPEGVSRQI